MDEQGDDFSGIRAVTFDLDLYIIIHYIVHVWRYIEITRILLV